MEIASVSELLGRAHTADTLAWRARTAGRPEDAMAFGAEAHRLRGQAELLRSIRRAQEIPADEDYTKALPFERTHEAAP